MLEVKNLSKRYAKTDMRIKPSILHVLDDVSFMMQKGEWMALIGESGSGKSTLSRLVLGLEKADQGQVLVEGLDISVWRKKNKGQMSVVFQDYTSSANPNFKVKDIIREPLAVYGRKASNEEVVEELLEKVGLPIEMAHRYPHELSGGQLQRVCIARAISTNPRFIVLDEAISSLDVSVQTQILDLLRELKEKMEITCLFIAHDLQTVAYVCDQVAFLHEGTIIEQVAVNNLAHVQSDYAQKLLEAVIRFNIE